METFNGWDLVVLSCTKQNNIILDHCTVGELYQYFNTAKLYTTQAITCSYSRISAQFEQLRGTLQCKYLFCRLFEYLCNYWSDSHGVFGIGFRTNENACISHRGKFHSLWKSCMDGVHICGEILMEVTLQNTYLCCRTGAFMGFAGMGPLYWTKSAEFTNISLC